MNGWMDGWMDGLIRFDRFLFVRICCRLLVSRWSLHPYSIFHSTSILFHISNTLLQGQQQLQQHQQQQGQQ